VALLVAEGLFRMLNLRGYHEPRVERDKHLALLTGGAGRVPGVSLQFRPYAEFAHVYDSNPRGTFDAENAVRYRMNRHGFRGADISLAKSDDVTRVVLLGDSFAFGAGVPLEDTLGFQLEGLLNAGPMSDNQVVTFAVGGWGTRDQILYLEHQGLEFEPDLVVVVYVLNDAGYAGGLDLWREFREQYQNRRLESSYLASSLYATVARRTLARRYVADLVEVSGTKREKWQESFSYLSRGQRLARARGAEFAVAIFPFLYDLDESYPFRSLHEKVVAYCVWNGIPVLDLFDAFEGRDYADLWVHPSDQHPNEQAHRIAAHALFDFIVNAEFRTGRSSSVRP
jgi:lysophospholipase L1-like esterase